MGSSTETEYFKELELRLRQLEQRTDALFSDLSQVKVQVGEHHQHVIEVKQLLADIKDLLQVYENARGTVTILAALGGVLKWLAGVGAAGVVLWVWLKTGIKS